MNADTSRHVVLTGHIGVPEEKLNEVRAALPDHIRRTRAEPGCLSFDVVESKSMPGRFDVSERFADADAFEAHQKRAQASDWAKITAGIERHYTISGPRK